MKKLLAQVEEVARGAGQLICDAEKAEVFVKAGRANFVTSMDLASQEYIIAKLKEILPDSNFFAEESDKNQMKPGYNWIIDPIDGTTNYMIGYKHSCISIGLVEDGKGVLGVIYDPYLDEMYAGLAGQGAWLNGEPIKPSHRPVENSIVLFGTATYYRELADLTFDSAKAVFNICGDVRRSGSASLDMCYAACGKCDAYYEILIQPWDYAAGVVIASEAGAVVKGLQGREIDFKTPVGMLVGAEEICARIEEIVDREAARLAAE
ncbi:MAG: inositol monophosphatase [Christensenellaceae bacterium]|nr:inositol monophosphatase [Christensenellaceae bacterium]